MNSLCAYVRKFCRSSIPLTQIFAGGHVPDIIDWAGKIKLAENVSALHSVFNCSWWYRLVVEVETSSFIRHIAEIQNALLRGRVRYCSTASLKLPTVFNYKYSEDTNLARVPLPSENSMSRSKNWELSFFLHVEKTKTMLGEEGKSFIDWFRPKLYDFIFKFPELTFHDFSLAPHQNIDISAK